MASKEDIERRVESEAKAADDRYTKHKGDVTRSFQAAVRPLVERAWCERVSGRARAGAYASAPIVGVIDGVPVPVRGSL